MPYDPALASRIRSLLQQEPGFTEKKMFGGIGFMLHGNMAGGALSDGSLLVRVAVEDSDRIASRPHASLLHQRGRAMRGWVAVSPEGFDDLPAWVEIGASYARSLPPK